MTSHSLDLAFLLPKYSVSVDIAVLQVCIAVSRQLCCEGFPVFQKRELHIFSVLSVGAMNPFQICTLQFAGNDTRTRSFLAAGFTKEVAEFPPFPRTG